MGSSGGRSYPQNASNGGSGLEIHYDTPTPAPAPELAPAHTPPFEEYAPAHTPPEGMPTNSTGYDAGGGGYNSGGLLQPDEEAESRRKRGMYQSGGNGLLS